MIADALYVGDTTIERVMLGEVEVWSADPVTPDLPVVTITGTTATGARNQFRAACTDYGTTYQTVAVLPFRLDTSNTTIMSNMFNGCSSLTSVPDLATSNVTSMNNMFAGCSALTSVPDLDTSNVTNMSGMFQNCSSLTSVPDLATGNVTNMSYMFRGCSILTSVPDLETSNVTDMSYMFYICPALTDGNVRLIGKHPDVDTTSMIETTDLTRLPFFDTDGNPI